MHFQRTALSTSLALAIGCTSSLSFAQKIEEIYVTARKTEEGLQTTPVAVSAMNEGMLADAQVTDIADLKRMAPSISIMSGGTASSSLIYIAIRGNAQVSPSGGTDPAVATYVDGVYLARPTGGNIDMFDVSLAEVLRGPQGTLFGRNTTGGALNIRTNDPTGNFDGYVKAEAGNYSHKKIEGVVNLPIIGDELAARFAVRHNERDGFGKYRGYSDPAGFNWSGLNTDASDVDQSTYARGKIRWAPNDTDLIVTLGLDWSKYKDNGQRSQVMAINPGANALVGGLIAANGFTPANFLNQQKYGDSYWNMDYSSRNPMGTAAGLEKPGSTNDNKGVFIDVDYDITDDLYFKSITAYRESESAGHVDLDGTPLTLLTFFSEWEQSQWSQEFQLSGSVNGDLDWITGLYYFTEDSSDFSQNRFGGADALALLPAGLRQLCGPVTGVGAIDGVRGATCISSNDAVHDNTSYGGFAQVNYHFTEKFRATLGYRYTYDERDTEIFSESISEDQLRAEACKIPAGLRDDGVTCDRTQKAKFHYPAWTFGLDYQALDNLFLYAKTSGASMAGGWNFRAFSNEGSFSPENVRDVEIGFKSDLFDGNVRLNGALFMAKATDQQRLINLAEGVTPVQFIRNAGESESKGAELELTWLPWEGMAIHANAAWLDMEYKKYESTENVGTSAAPIFVTLDRTSEHAPHAPELTYSIGATQTLKIGIGELDLHLDYSWVDETWFQDSTVNPAASAAVQASQIDEKKWNSVPDYGLVNALATLRLDGGHWEGTVWVRNLTDEEYYTNGANFWSAAGTTTRFLGDPRTFGASVRYNF